MVTLEKPENILRGILEKSTVKEIVSSQDMVSCKATDNITYVATILGSIKISSMPVFDKYGACAGLVDYSDIVAYLLTREWESNEYVKAGQAWKGFSTIPISKVLGLSKRNDLLYMSYQDTLLDAVVNVAKRSLRRMVVVDEEGSVSAVLSPSQMMKHIFSELAGRYDVTLIKTVEELDLGVSPVVTIPQTKTLVEAFYYMQKNHVSTIAVVDEDTGSMKGSISMSDARVVFHTKNFKLMMEPCSQFMQYLRTSDSLMFPYYSVKKTTRLQEVSSKLLTTGTHHMYVVDPDVRKPEKVISFIDICQAMILDSD